MNFRAKSQYDPDEIYEMLRLQDFFTRIISNPKMKAPPSSKKTGGRPGRPTKPFENKTENAKYREASDVLSRASSSQAIYKAASIAAHRDGLFNAAYIYRLMENDPEETANRLKSAQGKASQIRGMSHLNFRAKNISIK